MHPRTIRFMPQMIVLAVSLALVPSLALAGQSESVPVLCSEGKEPLPLKYDDRTSGCQIDAETDEDSFSFTGVANDRIRVIVSRTSGTFCPRLELWDTSLVTWNATCGDDLILDAVLRSTGKYQLFLNDWNQDKTGAYMLHLHKIPHVFDAPGLAYGSTAGDRIDFGTDVDFFDFQGAAGSTIKVIVSRESGAFCPRVELWAPGTPPSFVTWNATCGDDLEMIAKLPAITGTYLLTLSDWNLDNVGDYLIRVQCLAGPCPSSPAPPPDLEGYEHLKGKPLAGRQVCVKQSGVADRCTTTNAIGYWKFAAGTLVKGKSFQVIINGPVVSTAVAAATSQAIEEEPANLSESGEDEKAQR
jgi:hypothetical protein